MKQWYIIHTLVGAEKKVKTAILEKVEELGLADSFGEIIVPTVEVTAMRAGKQIKTEKKFMSGYVVISMKMDDVTWRLVLSVPKVTGFLGSVNRPTPVGDQEIKKILNQMEERTKDLFAATVWDIGDEVTVTDGPFDSFNGRIESVDTNKEKLRVSISILGRITTIDLNFDQVKKA